MLVNIDKKNKIINKTMFFFLILWVIEENNSLKTNNKTIKIFYLKKMSFNIKKNKKNFIEKQEIIVKKVLFV